MVAFFDPRHWRGQACSCVAIYCSLEPRHKRMLTLVSQFEMRFPYCARSETDGFGGSLCSSRMFTGSGE